MDFAVIAWSFLLAYFSFITAIHGNSIPYCSELYKCDLEPKDILKIEVNCTNNSNVFVKWSPKNDNSDLKRITLEYSCNNITGSGEQLPGYPANLGVYLSTIYNGHTSISNLPISKDVECTFGGCVELYGAYSDCWQPNIEVVTCNYTESTSSHISPTSTTLKTFSTDIDISVVVNSTGVKSALILMSSPLVSSVNSYILSSSSISQSTKFESPTVITSFSLISMTTESISPSDPNVPSTFVLAIMSSEVTLIIFLCGLILMACLLNYRKWAKKTDITQHNDENMENGWLDIIFKLDDTSIAESVVTIEHHLSLQNKQHKEENINVNSNIKFTSDLKQSIIPSISQPSISNKYIEPTICSEIAVSGNSEVQNDTTSNMKEVLSSIPDFLKSGNKPLTRPANSLSPCCPMNDSGYLSSSNITFGITDSSSDVQHSLNSGEQNSFDDAYDFIMEIIENENDEEAKEEIDKSDVSYSYM